MANPKIGIDVIARLDGLRDELKKSDKDAKALVAGLTREIAKAEKAHKDSAKKTGDSWRSALGVLKGSAKASGFGALAEKATAASEAVAGLLDPVGLAVAGIAAATAVAAAGALAVGALGAGLVEAGFSAKAAEESLKGFEAIGSDFYPAVPAETQASIDALAASGDALDSIWNKFVVTVGANVAPGIEHLTDVVVGAALTAEEWFEGWVKGRDLLGDFAAFVTTDFLQTFRPIVDALRLTAKGLIVVSELAGHEVPQNLKDTVSSFDALDQAAVGVVKSHLEVGSAFDGLTSKGKAFLATQERATAAVKGGSKAAADLKKSLDAAAKAQGDLDEAVEESGGSAAEKAYDQTIKKLREWRDALFSVGQLTDENRAKLAKLSSQARVDLASSQAKDAADAAKKVQDATDKAQGYVDQATSDELDAYQKLQADKEKLLTEYLAAAKEAGLSQGQIAADTADIEIAYAHKVSQANQAKAQEGAQFAQQAFDLGAQAAQASESYHANLASQLEQQYEDSAGKLSERQRTRLKAEANAQKKAATAAFNVQKGLAEGSAIVSTAAGVAKALADYPYPYSLIPAALVAAQGAIQIGTIAAEQPSFNDTPGVMQVGQSGGQSVHLANRDYFAAAQSPDELRRQVGVGPMPMGDIRVVAENHYRHRVFNEFILDNWRMGGQIRQLVEGQNPRYGHRARTT